MKNYYAFPAFFYFDEDGISIEFPDLPGCLPCAQTQEEAFHNAKEALGCICTEWSGIMTRSLSRHRSIGFRPRTVAL